MRPCPSLLSSRDDRPGQRHSQDTRGQPVQALALRPRPAVPGYSGGYPR